MDSTTAPEHLPERASLYPTRTANRTATTCNPVPAEATAALFLLLLLLLQSPPSQQLAATVMMSFVSFLHRLGSECRGGRDVSVLAWILNSCCC